MRISRYQVVEALRELGHNLLTTYESGKAGQAVSDEDILASKAA